MSLEIDTETNPPGSSKFNLSEKSSEPFLQNSSNERIHYLDHIRAIAMLLGIVLHAAMAYGTGIQEFTLVKDNQHSAFFDVLLIFIHLFRMALFFLIAGFFAHLLVNKRGIAAFIKNRCIRITLPFVIFLPIISVAIGQIFLYVIENASEKSQILQLMESALINQADLPISTSHLWFLYQLIFFCAAAAILANLSWPTLSAIRERAFSSTALIHWFPLCLIPALQSVSVPIPAPDSLVPQLWSFGFYGIYFFIGWQFFYHHSFLDIIKPQIPYLVSAVIVGFFVVYLPLLGMVGLPPIDDIATLQAAALNPEFSILQLTLATIEAYLGVYLVFICLYYGKRLLNFQNEFMRYISDASYWMYLLHLPIVFIFQYLLADLAINVFIKYLVCVGLTFIVCLLSYEYLIRYTPIGTMLNGKKTRQSQQHHDVAFNK